VCGSVVDNSLRSPEYPNRYPSSMQCNYTVPIPHGMALNIYFDDFKMEYEDFCSYDYLEITDENSTTVGVYCGEQTGRTVDVTGSHIVVTFHSDFWQEERGYLILFTSVSLSCGSVAFDSLKSPGYQNNYPSSIDCLYSVPIPQDWQLNVYFHDFQLQEDNSSCNHDYLMILNEKKETFGVYCGLKTGKTVFVSGNYAVIKFHSDDSVEERGFLILFTTAPAKPKVMLSSRVVRTLPGYIISTCSATGTPPVYIALVRNSTTLANTTNKYVEDIQSFEEGKYACVASSTYGTDVREFKVIFIGENCEINNLRY